MNKLPDEGEATTSEDESADMRSDDDGWPPAERHPNLRYVTTHEFRCEDASQGLRRTGFRNQ